MDKVAGLPPRFNALDPALLDDPYPIYARLRRAGPVCRGGPATWVVSRYADVARLLRDPRLGHEFPETLRRAFTAAGGQASTPLQRIVSGLEPPDHTRIRQLLSKAFSPVVVRTMRDQIRRRMDELLVPALDHARLDVVNDLALPLQITVTCDLLGVPTSDRDEIWPRAVAIGRAFILVPFVPENQPPADEDAATWLRDYVAALLDQRRKAPGDDLLSRMLAARHLGAKLTDEEIVENAVFLFFAGFETSMYLLTSGCAALLHHPLELARLRADRSLMSTAVEEFLRYDAPIQWITRMTGAPVEIGGRTIKAGRAVVLLLASANHDEHQFAEPGRLDVGRHPNPHLSFGGGIHHCLGVVLAREEGAIVFDRLLDRCAVFEPAGATVRRPHPNLRGYTSIPIAVKPA